MSLRPYRNSRCAALAILLALPLICALVVTAVVPRARAQDTPVVPASVDASGIWRTVRVGVPLDDVQFIDTFHGWSMGGMRRTTDGGETWSVLGARKFLDRFFFISPLQGWRASREWFYESGITTIDMTTDGGLTWTRQYQSSHDYSLPYWTYLSFVDKEHGFALGSGALRTNDGGKTWVGWNTYPTEADAFSLDTTNLWHWTKTIDFTSEGEPIRQLVKTTDGGVTQIEGGKLPQWAVGLPDLMSDGRTVVIAGKGGRIARSEDFGKTWTNVASPTTIDLAMPRFADDNNGWVFGGKQVFRTQDGGRTWRAQVSANTGDITRLIPLRWDQAFFIAERIYRTRDAGMNWIAAPYASDLDVIGGVEDLAVAPGGQVYGAGSESMITSKDGGLSWSENPPPAERVDTVGQNHVWALSGSGLYRSVDGGKTWQKAAGAPSSKAMDFVSETQGWAVGYTQDDPACRQDAIYKSEDGGASWRTIKGDPAWGCDLKLSDIFFLDAQRGWVVGSTYSWSIINNFFLLRTEDGGETWQKMGNFMTATSFDGRIHFTSPTVGWVAGGRFLDYSQSSILLRTTDGGRTWTGVGPHDVADRWYRDIDFAGSSGWVVGDKGIVVRTTDGGATWSEQTRSPGAQLLSVELPSPDIALIGCEGGLMLRWDATASPCMVTPTAQPRLSATPPASGSFSAQAANCVDDAHERREDAVRDYTNGSVFTGRIVSGSATSTYTGGLLFRSLQIPRYATISSAKLKLYVKTIDNGPVTLRISAERRDIGRDFNPANPGIAGRPRTSALVTGALTGPVNGWFETPDLAPVIQEIVGRLDWLPGNDIALIIETPTDSGAFISWNAYDAAPSQAAQLDITYRKQDTSTPPVLATDTPSPTPTTTPTVTETPTVSAQDQRTYLPLLVR